MTAMPEVAGLFEAHLTVSDLDRSIAFYRDVVGLPLALELPERGAAFFWIGGTGRGDARPVVARIGADGPLAAHRAQGVARRRPRRLRCAAIATA